MQEIVCNINCYLQPKGDARFIAFTNLQYMFKALHTLLPQQAFVILYILSSPLWIIQSQWQQIIHAQGTIQQVLYCIGRRECIHWGRPFHKWKMFSADPSYSENCFQLILGYGFPLTQHAFLLTKHAFPLMYIFFCQVLVFNQHYKGLKYKMEGGTEKLGVINLYYVQRNIHNFNLA